MGLTCPACKAVAVDGSKFCEDCGSALDAQAIADVDPELRCSSCGAGPAAVDGDGFCTQCGTRRLAPPRDHIEVAVSAKVAGVSDIGTKYTENQDYFALATGPRGETIGVVCDGVSLSQHAMDGSKLAAETIAAAIVNGLDASIDPDVVVKRGLARAQQAICTLPFVAGMKDDLTGDVIPPAQATAVAVLVVGTRVTIGWLGDSRAYWVGRAEARQLTTDHSWFNDVVASGEMTAEQARNDPRVRGIVKSLGADLEGANPGVEGDALTLNLTEPGVLLVVSDGFYTTADDATIRRLVHALPDGIDALALARHLVDHARSSGTKDNITVVAIIS
jgi:serine/threonine protein phosphatase PrpC